MKKIVFGLLLAVAASGFGGQIVKITFETQGPDCYRNGAQVADGECYALVWVRSGTSFAGFLADGSLADPANSRTLIVRPLAKDGRCTTFAYQAAEEFIRSLGVGGYAVCLLDTRGANGLPLAKFAADANGISVPVAVNGYQVVTDSTVSTEVVADTSATLKSLSFANPVQVETTAALPVSEAELKPVIKSAGMRDGKFVVTVEKTVPYLKYTALTGETPDDVTTPVGDAQSGRTQTVELEFPATGASGFYKVTADRNQN